MKESTVSADKSYRFGNILIKILSFFIIGWSSSSELEPVLHVSWQAAWKDEWTVYMANKETAVNQNDGFPGKIPLVVT